ncbi:MAG: biotin transporter BioY [Hyphomicrobiales bacterium]|nr:biotin transporter BioY [Hyphomicrobiales bacterium]
MNATTLDVGTLAGRLIGREGLRGLAARIALVVAGAALLTIAAKIKVPFYPVPMTLQTLAIFFIGATLGARLGALSVILYVAEGLMGFPVFTNTPPAVAGPAYLMGPTGGYLLGFLMAALIVGNAARRGLDRSVWRFAIILVMADVVLFACGLSWLMTSLGIDAHRAVQIGLLPFLPGEALKIAVAAFAMPLLWQATARLRRG